MITCYQNYWWFLISVLGAALVFLLFVQGGQTLLPGLGNNENKRLAINAHGRNWDVP
ncbi:MAG: cytochrome d ubiquinol oxidase subunit II [Muribaculaceae bacterium]|nr:cytochrome d ubiquinol oxidase subunit II [Muribaculaceae bacterium]